MILPGDNETMYTCHAVSLQPAACCQYLPGRSLCTRLSPSFCKCCPRVRSLEHLTLAHKSHRTTAIKEAFLNRHSSSHGYISGPSAERQTKVPIPLFLTGRGVSTFVPSCCLRIRLPISLHPGTEWDPRLGYCLVLAHPQPLRATKNKEDDLDHHKALRYNQELRPG